METQCDNRLRSMTADLEHLDVPSDSVGRGCHINDAADIRLKICQDWLNLRGADSSAEPTNKESHSSL